MWNVKEKALQPTMEGKKEKQNRQLELMLTSIQERLRTHEVEKIAELAGVDYDPGQQLISFESLGQKIEVEVPEYRIRQELEMWHHLTLLQYLETADGTPLAEEKSVISLTEMSGGLARGFGFNKDIEKMFARWFGDVEPEEFRQACLDLKGKITEGRGDVTAVLPYMPKFPVMVNFWCADDEFPASGKTLLNKEAEHYLTIEAAGGVCSIVVQAIRDRIAENRQTE